MRNVTQLRPSTLVPNPPPTLEGPKLETESMDMDRDADRQDEPSQLPVLHPYGTRKASGIQTTKRPYPEYLGHTTDLRRRQEYQRSGPTPPCRDDQVSIDSKRATYFLARSSDGGASACKIENGHDVDNSFNGNSHTESMQVPMDEGFGSGSLSLSDLGLIDIDSLLNLPTPSTTLLPGLRLPATTNNHQGREILQTRIPKIPATGIQLDTTTTTPEVFNLFELGPDDGSFTIPNSDSHDSMSGIISDLDLDAMFHYDNNNTLSNPFGFDFQDQSAFPAWETNVRRPRTRLPDVTEQSVSPTSTNHSHSGQPLMNQAQKQEIGFEVSKSRVAQVRPRSRSLPPTASRSPSPDTLKIPEPDMKNEGTEVPVVPLSHAHVEAAASNSDGHPQSAATPTANGNAATATGPGNSPSNVLNNGVGQGQGSAAVGAAGLEQIRTVINTGFSHVIAHVNGKFAQVFEKLDAVERRQLLEERQRADERGNSSTSTKLEELDKKFTDIREELKALRPIVTDRVQKLADKLDNVEAKIIETSESIMGTIHREHDKLKELISSKMDPKTKEPKDKVEPEPASSALVVPMQAIDDLDLGAAAAALDVPVSSVSTSQGGSNNTYNEGRKKNAIIVVRTRRATNSLRSASVLGVQNQKKRGNSSAVPSAPSELVSFRMPSALSAPASAAPARRGRGRPRRKRSASLNSAEAFEMKTGESGVASSSLVIKEPSNNGGGGVGSTSLITKNVNNYNGGGIRRGRPRIGSDTKIVAGIDHTGIYADGNSHESYGKRLTRSKSASAVMKRVPKIAPGSTRRSRGKGASGTHGFVLRRRVQLSKA